jgi:hypothetical protein
MLDINTIQVAGGHKKKFETILRTLGDFLSRMCQEEALLRDEIFLQFLEMPIHKRERLVVTLQNLK